ncbi:MAG: radical SAM family heme chaperone HemW [bacterium]
METAVQNFPALRPYHELSRGLAGGPAGIYIHFPFCRAKCNYCAFVSGPPASDAEMDRYLDALVIHLRLGAAAAAGRTFSTLFLGGGTPSLLGPARLARLFETVFEHYAFTPDAEITLEANPESATRELFETLRPLGLNRVSLGAQSFNPVELARIGRVHSVDQIHQAVDNARAAGIGNLSLDLIFAWPGQSVESWRSNLRQALACGVDHLSAYALTYEEGTLLDRLRREGKITPVLDETYITMYDETRDILSAAGWIHYEISNWRRPGRECRHNRIYWNRDEYLAFGASAHGMFRGLRYGLIQDTGRYVRTLASGALEASAERENAFLHPDLLAEWVAVTPEEMASDVMIFGLRQTEGISLLQFEERFGYTVLERWGAAVRRLQERDLLEQNGDRIRLTSRAYMLSNEVFVHFLD